PNGTPAAMVIVSFISISLEPPLVGFFVVFNSTSWPVLREQTRLGISVLGESHLGMVREITKKDPARFDAAKWLTRPQGEMLIRGAVTHMTGTISSIQRVGDHDFVVLALENINSGSSEKPLVFQDRRMQVLGA